MNKCIEDTPINANIKNENLLKLDSDNFVVHDVHIEARFFSA